MSNATFNRGRRLGSAEGAIAVAREAISIALQSADLLDDDADTLREIAGYLQGVEQRMWQRE